MVATEEIHLRQVSHDEEVKIADREIADGEDETYKQIKPMNRSQSDPNILTDKNNGTRQSRDIRLKEFKGLANRHLPQRKQYSSLYIFGPKNRIRMLAIWITESKVFEYFILLAILFTCVVMAIDAPLPGNDKSEKNKVAHEIEFYLLTIFCCEAVLKIIALGFVMHPHSYLRSPWNILDFIVVVSGIFTLEVIIGAGDKFNVKALRAVRVLRPLKLISGIPSLQVVMTSIVRAMIPLLQVLFLVVFVIIIYAIIGLEFYGTRFHHSCMNAAGEFDGKPCDPLLNSNKTKYYVYGRKCPNGTTCTKGFKGLNDGISAFDNIFLSMITVFQCITMEGWTDIMYHTFMVMDIHGYIFSIYYISLIIVGAFFMLNLVLGVLSGEFAKEREKVENRREFIKLRYEQKLNRMVDSYLEWILKGEDAIVLEQSAQNIAQVSEAITDVNNSVIANPALVFTSSRNYRVNIGRNHKSKLERVRVQLKKSRVKTRTFVKHRYFFWFVIFMVAINTIIMATRHYQQPEWLKAIQDVAEIIFVTIFVLELLVKLFAHGIVGYCHSLFNIFDLVVVVLSILEIILRNSLHVNLGLSVLRCLRLLKAFKVTKYWSSLGNLVASLMHAMKSILSLMFLLFLFIVIAALLGMQLFGGKFVKLKEYPRTNFDTFSDSLLAVFQVITGEDWNVVMYDGMMAYDGPKTVPGVCISIYFIFLVIFGNYTLLNVFLAIAVDNLTNAEILTHDEEAEIDEKNTSKIRRNLENDPELANKAITFVNNLHMQTVKAESEKEELDDTEHADEKEIPQSPRLNGLLNGALVGSQLAPQDSRNGPVLSSSLEGKRSPLFTQVLLESRGRTPLNGKVSPDKYREQVQRKWRKIVEYSSENPSIFLNIDDVLAAPKRRGSAVPAAVYTDQGNQGEDYNSDDDIEQRIKEEGILNVLKVNVTNRRRIVKSVPMIQKSSLFIMSPNNRFRVMIHKFVHIRYFDWFIMLVILMSSITLALEDTVNLEAPINQTLNYFDYVFTAVFGLEVLLKVIDAGFVLHKGSYLRNPWNVLDAVVFACNLASIILSSHTNKWVETLRVLRVLRPLKAIQRVKKLKAVFQCMVYSLRNVTFVLIITTLILFIFACIGVQLFNGKFWYCTDQSKMTTEECQGKYYVFKSEQSVVSNKPKVETRIWKSQEFHFDNILDALFTLYACSTGEGWPSSMHTAMDATQQGRGPITNYNQQMAIYYIVFVVIFTFMLINIYIALIILTFQRQGEKEIEGGLDRNQRDCLQSVLTVKPRQRYMPSNKNSLSYHVWVVVDSDPFEYFIMTLIVLNTLQLMMKFEGSPNSYKDVLYAFNIAFTCLFCMEAALKIIAYRQNYFKEMWNLFDLLVILGSLLDILLSTDELKKFIDPTMFRLCRTARMIKLLRKGQSIRIMLWTFVQSFKALPYVTTLIALLLYIYAIIGMQMFAKDVKLDDDSIMNNNNNFKAIIPALQVLFRSSTGESWNNMMYQCAKDLCNVGDNNRIPWSCGHKWLTYLYFASFIFFMFFFMLNLFVAVIMDNFEYLTRDSSILGPHHMEEFVASWSEFDPQATGKINHTQLYTMFCRMSPPVGFGKKCPKNFAYKRLIKMNMPVDSDGAVDFHPTLLALIRTSLDIFVEGNVYDNDKELRRVIKSIWPKAADKSLEKAMPKMDLEDDEVQMTVGKIYCVKLMVMKYRNKMRRKKGEESFEEEEPHTVFQRLNSLLPASFRRKDSRKSKRRSRKVERHNTFHDPNTMRRTQHAQHHPRDAQLRRRSSWSDISSFFKFNKGRSPTAAEESESEQVGASPSIKPLPTSGSTPVTTSRPSTSSYGKPQQKGKPIALSRSPSLRMNSNGNVIPSSSSSSSSSSKHRRVQSNVHLLQYDSINKGSSVRYQPNKSGMSKATYVNSAPPTPKGGSGLAPSRQNPDYRSQNPSSPNPLPRRIGTAPPSSAIRRPTPHTASNFTEQHIRDHNFHNNKQYNNDPRQDNRYDGYQSSHDPRPRSLSDSRKPSQHHGRQELSKEHFDTMNHYGPYESSENRRCDPHRVDSNRTRSNQDSGTIPIHMDNRYIPPPHDDRYHNFDQRLAHPHDNRMDNRQMYPPQSIDNNFRPVDSYSRDIQGHSRDIPGHQPGDRFDHDYRGHNPDYSASHMSSSVTKVGNNMYRKDYGNHPNDNKMLGRESFQINKITPGDTHKLELRTSPRSGRPAAPNTGGEAYPSSSYLGSADTELLNAAPSQQYYDSMISQINNQIARVSEGGASSQQPFNTHFHKPLPPPDDDDNEWC